MQLQTVSENALILRLGTQASPEISARVQACTQLIELALGEDLVDLVPSYASVLVIYNALHLSHIEARRKIHEAVAQLTATTAGESKTVTLPVYYAVESGPDLEDLARHAQMSIDDVIELHSSTLYRVYAIGFAPGFAYLGDVDARIAAPRLATPRPKVPRGAVGIADQQTAVYPAVSPGGWNLIGRCPTAMFNPQLSPSMPVDVGDQIRFEAVSRERFLALGGDLSRELHVELSDELNAESNAHG